MSLAFDVAVASHCAEHYGRPVFLKHTQRPIAGAINTINLMPRFGTRRSVAQIKPEASVPSETSFRESTLNLFEFPDDRAINDVPYEEIEPEEEPIRGRTPVRLRSEALFEEARRSERGVNVSKRQVNAFLQSSGSRATYDDLLQMGEARGQTVRQILESEGLLDEYKLFVESVRIGSRR
jgi:hypothetical protein